MDIKQEVAAKIERVKKEVVEKGVCGVNVSVNRGVENVPEDVPEEVPEEDKLLSYYI